VKAAMDCGVSYLYRGDIFCVRDFCVYVGL